MPFPVVPVTLLRLVVIFQFIHFRFTPVSDEERARRAKGREELRYKGLKDISTVCSLQFGYHSKLSLLIVIMQLFNQYIKPIGLWESGLHALKVAHYVDEALTKRFWKNIINEGTNMAIKNSF